MRTFTLMLICFLAFNTASAQTDYPPMVALDNEGQLWLYGYDAEPRLLVHGGEPIDSPISMEWSPDGRYLALVACGESDCPLLFEPQTNTLIELAMFDHIQAQFPLSFGLDENTFLYAVDDPIMWDEANLYRLELNREPIPEMIGSVPYDATCYGGDLDNPAEMLYAYESDIVRWTEPGTFVRLPRIFVETPYGILYPPNCIGGTRLYLPETDEDIDLPHPQVSTVVSFDRMRLAGRSGDQIIVTDLDSMTDFSFRPNERPELLAWNRDGNLFYTVREESVDLLVGTNEEERTAIRAALHQLPDTLPAYNVSIRYVDVTSGTEEILYEAYAYGIGRIMPNPYGDELYFSQIPNLEEWIEYAADGTTDLSHYASVEWFGPIQASLYKLDLTTRQVELIGAGLNQATINFAAMSNQ